MNQYLIYDPVTGAAKQTVTAATPPEDLGGVLLLDGPVDLDRVRVIAGELQPYDPPVDIERIKQRAKKRVDAKAAKLRSLIGSHGYGQEMVYIAKENEARACLSDPAPDAANYPMMVAEVGITGVDLHGVATAVVQTALGWKQLAAALEATRLGTKKLIDEVVEPATEEDVAAIENAAQWPNVEA